MLIEIRTNFDITETGVKVIKSIDDIDRRNSQMNFDTILQTIGLRTQPENISTPRFSKGYWTFTFTTEREAVWLKDDDELALLREDLIDTPVIKDGKTILLNKTMTRIRKL